MIHRPAYTLIETVIVAVLIAVLSVGFTISVQDIVERNALKSNEARVVNLIQQARSMALSKKLLNGQEVEFYLLELTAEAISLSSNDGTVLSNTAFTRDVTASWEVDICSDRWRVWYSTKDGSLSFDEPAAGCDTDARSREFTLHSPQDKYQAHYSVDVYGGFPQALSPETPQ